MSRLFLLLPLLCLLACSSGRYTGTPTAATYADYDTVTEDDRSGPTLFDGERLVAYDAYLRLVVAQPDSVARQLVAVAKSTGGYALEVGTDRAVLRVPNTDLDAVLTTIGTMGKVRNKSLRGRDVNLEYYDLETRLKNARATQTRFRELLEEATNVTDVLAVEAELGRVTYEVESLQGQINRLEETIDFATITVGIEEKVRPGPVGAIFKGLYEGVKWLFVW